jgi:AcrR family transcriptional regulator
MCTERTVRGDRRRLIEVIDTTPDPVAAGRRGPLNRHRVVRAAIHYIDTNGLPDLTMRRLASTLGVEAMSLYKHVSGRDNLLDTVVEALLDDLYSSPDVQLDAADGWQDYLRRVAFGVRGVALEHPQVFPLVATRPPTAPWIRPPLRSLAWIEAFLYALRTQGFGEQQAVDAYKAFTSFLLGHLLLEVAGLQVAIGPDETSRLDDSNVRTDLRGYPTVRRVADRLAQDTAAEEFSASLENLLRRLGQLREGSTVADQKGANPQANH